MTNSKPTHFAYLDGIRGFALLLVMIFHASMFTPNANLARGTLPFGLDTILINGEVGVDLFFVLSGFLITGVLLRNAGQSKYFRDFYARRSLRIFPLYYLALVFWAVVTFFFPIPVLTDATSFYWPWMLTFTSNIFMAHKESFAAVPRALQHFWSLAIEEQFYLLWPAAVLYLSRKNLLRLSGFLVILAPLLRLYFGHHWIRGYLFTFARFDGLALGAMLALWRENARALTIFRRLALPAFVLFFFLSVIHPFHSLGTWLSDTTINICFAGMLASSMNDGLCSRFFSQRWMGWFGRRSYGGYVIHQPFIIAVILFVPWLKNQPAIFYLFIPFLCLPLVELVWRLWEEPFLRLKSRFDTRS